MEFCTCPATMGNTGKPNCEPIQGVAKKLIFVNLFDSTGARNSILKDDVIHDAYISDKLNETDESKRWFISDKINTVVDERADKVTQSIDNIDYITDEGARTFTANMNQGYTSLSKYKRGECVQNLAVFFVDKNNKILGEISGDGEELYPVAIEQGTYSAKPIAAGVGTLQQNQLKFTFSELVSDASLRSKVATGDILTITGLLDVNAEESNVSATGFTLTLATDYGYVGASPAVGNWDETFFTVYNVTQAAPVTVTSVTETPVGSGVYVFVASATSADVVTINQANPVADGYDLSTTITIP